MTSQLAPTVRRALAALLALGATVLAAVSLAVLTAAPAAAEVPTGWSDPDPVDPVFVLLVVGGVIVLTQLGGSKEDGGVCANATEVKPAR